MNSKSCLCIIIVILLIVLLCSKPKSSMVSDNDLILAHKETIRTGWAVDSTKKILDHFRDVYNGIGGTPTTPTERKAKADAQRQYKPILDTAFNNYNAAVAANNKAINNERALIKTFAAEKLPTKLTVTELMNVPNPNQIKALKNALDIATINLNKVKKYSQIPTVYSKPHTAYVNALNAYNSAIALQTRALAQIEATRKPGDPPADQILYTKYQLGAEMQTATWKAKHAADLKNIQDALDKQALDAYNAEIEQANALALEQATADCLADPTCVPPTAP